MTFLVKCNNCDKVQEARYNETAEPLNPINDETGTGWWSRTKDGKTIHACSQECIVDGALVFPL